MYRGSAGGPSSGMDYDPLPMNIYDSKGKKSKKSSGLAIAHLCSPMGAVITLFALAVWGPCTAPSARCRSIEPYRSARQTLAGIATHRTRGIGTHGFVLRRRGIRPPRFPDAGPDNAFEALAGWTVRPQRA
jgi:hypothetical protein